MHARVETLVVVVLHMLSFGARKHRTAMSQDHLLDHRRVNSLLSSNLAKCSFELSVRYFPSCLVLDTRENQVDVCSRAQLVENLAVLAELGKCLAFHLDGTTREGEEDLLGAGGSRVLLHFNWLRLFCLLRLLDLDASEFLFNFLYRSLLNGRSAHISTGAVANARQVGDGSAVKHGRASVGVNPGVETLVVVELDLVCLGALQERSFGALDESLDLLQSHSFFLTDKLEAVHKFLVSDSPGSLRLDFSKHQVDIRGSELLVEQLEVLGQLCKRLSVHGSLFGSAVSKESCFNLASLDHLIVF